MLKAEIVIEIIIREGKTMALHEKLEDLFYPNVGTMWI